MTKYEHEFPRAYRVYKLVDTPEKVIFISLITITTAITITITITITNY